MRSPAARKKSYEALQWLYEGPNRSLKGTQRVTWSAPEDTQDDPDVTWDGKEMPKMPDKMPKTLDCLSKAFLLLEHGRRRESNKSGG